MVYKEYSTPYLAKDESGGSPSDSNREENRRRGQTASNLNLNASGMNFDNFPAELIDGERKVVDSQFKGAIEKRFGKEVAERVEKELGRIMRIEDDSIGNLRMLDVLPEEGIKLSNNLSIYGINADNLTLQEAQEVFDYAINKTPEIKKKKAERIYDALTLHINGVKSRRDGKNPHYYNPKEAERKEALQERFIEWEKGGLCAERGFDVNLAYERLMNEGYEPSRALRKRLEEDDVEELYEEGLIDDDAFFVYGPFTEDDLRGLKIYRERTWTDITNPRYFKQTKGDSLVGKSLSSILNTTVQSYTYDTEKDLVSDFVASEVLQERRLKVRDLTMASSALALWVLDLKEAKGEYSKENLALMRRSASFAGMYLWKIFDYSRDEIKGRFKSTRPLTKEFFDEMATMAENLTESRANYLEESFKPYLTKLNEHMYNIWSGMRNENTMTSIFDEVSEEYD